ncbi:hypothetical protein VaNZ11_005273 [Volvox africanus]|uniref:ANK_REP_REGION domain-containing protein n=1 Tax=Volvox africanus TaxID=51714 RepID=A0ABQ5RYB6_9CHLO|nr:hypothetical protein VaNZ11_005273 [Volvox africanus]
MLNVIVLPYPTTFQQALVVSMLVGIVTVLLHCVLRRRRLPDGRTLRHGIGKVQTQPAQMAKTHSEPHTCDDKAREKCSGHCSISEMRTRANSWATELFPQSQLNLGLEPQPAPLQNLCAYSPLGCHACSSPKSADSGIKTDRYHPDDDATPAAASASVTRSPSASFSVGPKPSGDLSQSLASSPSPAIVPMTPPGACPSKHAGGCGVTDVASVGASGATSGIGGALPSDTSFRPDNTSSAYDTARALVCHPWAQPYTPVFTLGRIALKIPDRDPSDLGALAVWTRPYCEALESEGIALVGVYVRQGCIHIVVDLLDLTASNSSGDNSGNGVSNGAGNGPYAGPRPRAPVDGRAATGGQHSPRHGRHLLGTEREEHPCSSSGSSRSNSRRRSGRVVAALTAGDPGVSDGSGVTAAAFSLANQSGGRVSAPGDLLPLAAPSRDRPTTQQHRPHVGRHNTPARVRSAEVAASGAAGPARIAGLVRVAAINAAATGGDRSRSDGDDDGGSQHEDNNGDDDEDDGSGTIAPRSRLHLLSARRLRQLRRASASSLLSGAAAVLGGGVPAPPPVPLPPLPSSTSHDSVTGSSAAAQPPQPGAATAFRLPATLTPETLVHLLGPDIGGGGQTVTVQLPSGGGTWSVQMRQAGGAAIVVPSPPSPRPPPDLTCISPPCVLAGAQGPVMMYAAGTDMHGVATGSGEGATAATGSDTPLTVHMRFRGAYQPCRASLLGDQMPAEALSRVLPLDALRRAEVLCLQLAVPPSLPGLMFVECQRGGLLGAASPVLVAPNAGVWQEIATLQDAAVREGGAALTAVQHLVIDLGLWLEYLTNLRTPPAPQPLPSQRQQQQQQSQARLQPLPSRLPPPPPAPAPLHVGTVQALPQPEVSPQQSTVYDDMEFSAVSDGAGGQPPTSSVAGSGAGIGLGRLFGRSLLRLLSDAELVDPQRQLTTSPQSQQLPQQQQQQQQQRQQIDGIRQLEEMLATAEQHQEKQLNPQRHAIMEQRQSWLRRDAVPGSASIAAAGTSGALGALEAVGLTRPAAGTGVAPETEQAAMGQHAGVGPQVLSPNMGVAFSSSPGPSADAQDPSAVCGDEVGVLDYMRAISDPQTRRVVMPAPSTSLARVENLGVQEARTGVLACEHMGVVPVPLALNTRSRPGGGGRAASGAEFEGRNDGDGGDEGAVLASVSIINPPAVSTRPLQPPSLPRAEAADALPSEVQGVLGMGLRTELMTTPAKPVVAASVATGSGGCGPCVNTCGLSIATVPQPPHAQSLFNGRWQLPSPPPSPLAGAVKATGATQLDQHICEDDGHMPPGTSPPTQAAGDCRGDSEPTDAADAGGLSPAVSINMLVLGPAEAATLSHALMGYGTSTRTGASGNLPPVRTESSGTELRSWDSLTEVAQAVSATLPLPSGALATTPRSCSTFIMSPSPSRRPSLHLYGDASRLRPSGAGSVLPGSCWPIVIGTAAIANTAGSRASSLDSLSERCRGSDDRESSPFLRCNLPSLTAEGVGETAAAEGSASSTLHYVAQDAEMGDAARGRAYHIAQMTAVRTEPASVDGVVCEGPQPALTPRPAAAESEIRPASPARAASPGAGEEIERTPAGTVETVAAATGAGGTIAGTAGSPDISSSDVSTAPAAGAACQAALAGAEAAVPLAAGAATTTASEPFGPPFAENAASLASASVLEASDAAWSQLTAGSSRPHGHWPAFNVTTIGEAPEITALLHARMRHLGLGLLIFSVRRGWLHITSELLGGLARVGMDLAEADAGVAAREGGMGLLHLAVTARQPALLRMLLAVATAPTAVGSGGTELSGAGRRKAFSWDVGARGPMGLTPLHLATALNDGGEVGTLLLEAFPEAPALWFTASDDSGCTPAGMASQAQLHGLTHWAGRRLAESAAWRWQHHPQQQLPNATDRPTQLVGTQQQQQQDVVLLQRNVQQRHEGGLQQPTQRARGGLSMQPQLQSDAFSFANQALSGGDSAVVGSGRGFGDDAGGLNSAAAAASTSAAATAAASSTALSDLTGSTARWNRGMRRRTAWSGRWLTWWNICSRPQQPPYRRESCLRASLTGFADSQMEERYRAYRVNSLSVIDTTCGLVFTCLFLLPALELAWQRRVAELASHCIFNAGLLGPYLLQAVAPALFRRHRDMVLCFGDVFKALLVLLAMLGVMMLPQVWADFARGHMDVVMLVIIKPLSEQIQVWMALMQRTAAVISDTYMYAVVIYGGAILPAAVRAVLQNTAALVLLLLLDVRARLRFLATVSASSVGSGTDDAVSCKMVNAHDSSNGAGLQRDVRNVSHAKKEE